MTYLIHNIVNQAAAKVNSNYNTFDEVLRSEGTLTFDGVYKSVYDFLSPFKEELKGREMIFFVTGDYVGGDNSFDKGMPREEFCTWDEIVELITLYDAKLGWHSWSHKDLTKLSDEELEKEVMPPFPMQYFAYPHGEFDQRVMKAVVEAGYEDAWSVVQGNGTEFQRKRQYLQV